MGKHTNQLNSTHAVNHPWKDQLIAYAALKQMCHDRVDEPSFAKAWTEELDRTFQFSRDMNIKFNQQLLRLLDINPFNPIEVQIKDVTNRVKTGAIPRASLQECHDFYQQLKRFNKINYNGLIKLIKKYTNHTASKKVCMELTPKLIASNFQVTDLSKTGSQLELLINVTPPADASEAHDADEVASTVTSVGPVYRTGSFRSLCDTVNSLQPSLLSILVAHRGFHSISDDCVRPLENTLPAYEQAWASGIRLCECDIHATVDGQIILHHDNTLQRLALHPDTPAARENISNMTLAMVQDVSMFNGSTSVLLTDVLDAAERIHQDAQLVIELKTGHTGIDCGSNLVDLILQNETYLKHVAVIMSFSRDIMDNITPKLNSIPAAKRPLLLLLCNTLEANIPGQVNLDVNDPQFLRLVDDEIRRPGFEMDGVYLQYDNQMMENASPRGRQNLALVSEKYPTGVWLSASDPDKESVATSLLSTGIKFLNSDFPDRFAETL